MEGIFGFPSFSRPRARPMAEPRRRGLQMMAGSGWWRLSLGAMAVAVLLLMSLLLPGGGGIRDRAVVEAGRTFLLMSPNPGEYTWNLLDALPARNQTPVLHRHVQFDRGDLVELELAPDLATGTTVVPEQRLALIESPALVRELNELMAERAALAAELALLRAGGRPEEVTEAQRRLELAQALRQGEQPKLERNRTLHGEKMISDADLELVELQDEARRLEIELARAQLAVVSGPARPEALDALDAQIAVLDAGLGELESILEAYVIRSPIRGILEMGGSTNILRVYDLDIVYLRIPIPQEARYRINLGSVVSFQTSACPNERFDGTIVDLGENAINLNGRQIFWGSAQVENPQHLLRSGMTGNVVIDAAGRGPGLMRSLWQAVGRAGP